MPTRTKLGLLSVAASWPLFVVGAIKAGRSPDFCEVLPGESHAVHVADHLDIAGALLIAVGVALAIWGGGPSLRRLRFRWVVIGLAAVSVCVWAVSTEIAFQVHDPFVDNGTLCP